MTAAFDGPEGLALPDPIALQETSSTNDDAKRLAADGCPHLTVVWARRQTAGRGSRQRDWVSIEGNLFWSVVLRPQPDWPRFTDLVFVNALAVLAAVRGVCGADTDLRLKWPNDLLLDGAKLAGSLIECSTTSDGRRPDWVVIGTGINLVDRPPATQAALFPPTSLLDHGYHARSDDLGVALQRALAAELRRWLEHGFDDVRTRYLANAYRLGREIRVGTSLDHARYRTGRYVDIDADGALILETDDGRRERVLSGDVIARAA